MRKKLTQAAKLVKPVAYTPKEGLELAKKTSYAKFDATLDLAIQLNLDVRKSEQQLRGTIDLPHGSGKKIVVAAVTNNPTLAREAKDNKVDAVFTTTEIEPFLKKGKFNFNVLVADPKTMVFLGKYGRVLGPKGLMPNPKLGTVTSKIGQTVAKIKKGRANYRTDKAGVVHVPVGKASFSVKALLENTNTILKEIKNQKPTNVKGKYFKQIHISATMGPSILIKLPT